MMMMMMMMFNNYEIGIKQTQVKYVKFTCPNRSHQKIPEGVNGAREERL